MLASKPTQCDKIIKYMRDFGEITAYNAFIDLGITQLAARIFELKRKGYTFTTEFRSAKNRYGEQVSYKVYKLTEKKVCAQ